MKSCDIRHIEDKDSFRWKWVHQRDDGTLEESAESYGLFLRVRRGGARECGYEPQLKT